jgi:hypothetical protein
VGPRLKSDRERFSPNNILLMITGGGLLWMGWAGFNGGAPYAANITASVAVLNTNVSAATSLLTWTCLDVIFFNKPSVIGAVQGMMTGLVCITPGAGVTNQLFLPIALYCSSTRSKCTVESSSVRFRDSHVSCYEGKMLVSIRRLDVSCRVQHQLLGNSEWMTKAMDSQTRTLENEPWITDHGKARTKSNLDFSRSTAIPPLASPRA